MNFIYRSLQFGFMHIWPALVLIVCAAFLPVSQLGVVAIFLSVATLFRPLVGLSLGRTAIRNAGAAFAAGGQEDSQRIIALATRLGFAASLLALAVIALAIPATSSAYDLAIPPAAVAGGAVFIFAFGITELLDGILRAQGRFRALASSVIVSRLVGIVLFLTALPLFPTLETLFASLAFAELVCVAMLAKHFAPAFRSNAAPSLFSAESVGLLKNCLPVIINALSVYLYARAMVMVAGLFDSGPALGGFEMAVQLTNLPMALTIVCATVMSPAIARLHARGTKDDLVIASMAASQAAAFSVWANMLAAGFLMVVGPFALLWLFPEVPAATLVLAIIAPLVALKAYAQVLSGELAIATGTAGTAARITLVFGALTVALGLALSALDGIRGAAIAMLIAHSLAVLFTVRILGRKTGLDIRYRGRESLIFALIATLPTAGVVLMLRESPATATICGTIVFFALTFLILYASIKRNGTLREPLLDGWRMLRNKNIGAQHEFQQLYIDGSESIPAADANRNALIRLIELRSPAGLEFWTGGGGIAELIPPQDHADIVYTLYLLGEGSRINEQSARRFAAHLAELPLYGKGTKGLNAHLSAYLLSTTRVLQDLGKLNRDSDVEAIYQGWRQDILIDRKFRPRWPRIWSHHIWRVSHWIGGAPSIVLHLADSGKVTWATRELLGKILDSSERHIIDAETGLLRPYRSTVIQKGFRKLYAALHDPDIADLGGVVHLLWVYHAIGRPYVARDSLNQKADVHLQLEPFMEAAPYCLDFDIVQLKRTAAGTLDDALKSRADRFIDDTLEFFKAPLSSSYSLHRLPGALATLHECAFITGDQRVRGIDTPRIDIIRTAYFL